MTTKHERVDVVVADSHEGYAWEVRRVLLDPYRGDWGTARVAAGWCRTQEAAHLEADTVARRLAEQIEAA